LRNFVVSAYSQQNIKLMIIYCNNDGDDDDNDNDDFFDGDDN